MKTIVNNIKNKVFCEKILNAAPIFLTKVILKKSLIMKIRTYVLKRC
mgnify:CR=1 FL=1